MTNRMLTAQLRKNCTFLVRTRYRGLGIACFTALLILMNLVRPAAAQLANAGSVTLAGTPSIASPLAGRTYADAGQVPDSQPMRVTVRLAPSAAQAADLEALLRNLTNPSSPDYRRFMTSEQFGARFGATPAQLAAVSSWLTGMGLTIDEVSTGQTRIKLSGTAGQLRSAFGVSIHNFQANGVQVYANVNQPAVPSTFAGVVQGVEGLDSLPSASATLAYYPGIARLITSPGTPWPLVTDALAYAINLNSSPVLALQTTACVGDLSAADLDSVRALSQQASAQGITVLVASGCSSAASAGLPATLPEVTSFRLTGGNALAATVTTDARPAWQFAPGLPADAMRYEPDLTVSTLDAFAATLVQIIGKVQANQTAAQQGTPARLGNINPVLYKLAPLQGMFTQPETTAALGSWEPGTGLGALDLTRFAQAFPSAAAATPQISIGSSNYTPTHGTSITLSSTVSGTSGGPVPTGSITFSTAAGGPIGTASINAGGTATYTTNGLAGGAYPVTATYNGDANYAPITSGTATVTVTPENPVITATAGTGTVVGGTVPVTVQVTNSSGIGTPSGTVTVKSGTQTVTGSLVSGAATIQVPATSAATASYGVSYSGDPSFNAGTSTVTATVAKSTNAVTFTIAPNPPVKGSPTVLTATVPQATGAPNATGSVQFLNGTTVLGSATLVNGTATLTSTLPAGPLSLTASYAGDANYAATTSAATTVSGGTITTTTGLVSTSYSSTFGGSFTLTATVLPATLISGTPPTGTVTFSSATQGVLGTATINSGGVANFTLSGFPVGTYAVTATYSGDGNYAASASSPPAVITVGATTATLAATIAPTGTLGVGSTATINATVTIPGATSFPAGGSVSAVINGTTYTAALSSSTTSNVGTASVTFTVPAAGSYTALITCATNTNYTCNTVTLNFTTAIVKLATTTLLSVSPTNPYAGQPVTLTATVQTTGNGNMATGLITFFDNGIFLANGVVTGNQVTVTATLKGATTHSLTASYSGDSNFFGSTSSPVTIVTPLVPSTISLSSNLTTALAGSNIILTATISSSLSPSGTASPTGTVTFYDTLNGFFRTLGSAQLVSNGPNNALVIFNAGGLTAGIHTIYAVYTGDSNFATVQSSTITLNITDFNVTFVPSTLTITRGSSGQASAILTSVGGFSGSVSFGCNPPGNSGETCSFNPATITGGSGTTQLTITTTSPAGHSTVFHARNAGTGWPGWLVQSTGGVAAAGLLLLTFPRRRRRLPGILLVLVAAVLIGASVGCSTLDNTSTGGNAGNGTPTPTGGTPLGTQLFTITVAGSDGVTQETKRYAYQVTVQ